MPTYSVETREATHDGDDYQENHQDFNTPEEVTKYINTRLGGEEYVHSVLKYEDGQTSNPRDVTSQFTQRKKFRF